MVSSTTDLCIYALSEIIEYFKSRTTYGYVKPINVVPAIYVHYVGRYNVAFLDASKAFDKISHWTLFRKLIDRRVM